jgi:hypothetical protein
MTGLRYVYAVCRPFMTPLQAELTGVGGAPAGLLHHHGLVAVVSTVPEADFGEQALKAHLEDLDWLAATARAHQGVVDALTTVTTPLPLRLATVFRDDSAVRVMIEAREDHFRALLDRLDGRVEWGVKVFVENEPAEPAGTTCGSGVPAAGHGRRPGSGPRDSRARCTSASPDAPRTSGCTLRRIPRSPGRPGRTCSTRPIWCPGRIPRNSWNWWTGRRTRPPGSGWN